MAIQEPKRVFDLGDSASLSVDDKGVAGVSSFDDNDVGKVIDAKVKLRLTNITRTSANKKMPFTYNFDALELEIPQQEEYIKDRTSNRRKAGGF